MKKPRCTYGNEVFDLALSFIEDADFKGTNDVPKEHVVNTHADALAREIQKAIDDYLENPGEIVLVGKLYTRGDIPGSEPVPPPPDLKLV